MENKPQRVKTKKNYYYEVLVRRTYKIKSVSRDEAEKIGKDMEKNIVPDTAEKIEDRVIKTRLLTESSVIAGEGKGASWN